MVHAAYGGPAQHLSSIQRYRLWRPQNVVNAPVVNRSLPGAAAKISKVLKQICKRFAVVLGVVSEKIGAVSDADFEIEVPGDKDKPVSTPRTRPVHHLFRKDPPARCVESVCMGADKNNLRPVFLKPKSRRSRI